jgi:hypothetical protein
MRSFSARMLSDVTVVVIGSEGVSMVDRRCCGLRPKVGAKVLEAASGLQRWPVKEC